VAARLLLLCEPIKIWQGDCNYSVKWLQDCFCNVNQLKYGKEVVTIV
jgi:hypothetical protein